MEVTTKEREEKMSYYRLQDPAYMDALTDGNQVSFSYCDGSARAGKSVCDSPEELAEYLANSGVEFKADWVLIELEGELSDEEDEDAQFGCTLIHPTEIVSTTDFDTFLDEHFDAAMDRALAA